MLYCVSFFFFFFSSSLFADGANQRATTLPIPRVVTRNLPISPRFMRTVTATKTTPNPIHSYHFSESLFLFCLFHHLSPMGPINELQRCPSRVWSQGIYLPISPRFTPTSFYRDAGSALLHLVNQWLNFSYSRPHAFRYGNQKKIALLLRLELINFDFMTVCCTH